MKKILFATMSLLLAGAVPALATDAGEKFTQIDTSKDGNISWEEFQKAYPKLSKKSFERLAANKKNSVSIEEWQRIMRKFLPLDENGDGYVTWDEFKKALPKMQKAAFESIDTDKDGNISIEEWADFMEQHSKGMSGGQGMGKGMPPAGMGGGAAPEGKPMITPPSK